MKHKWLSYLVVIVIALFAMVYLADRASAHTPEELDLWFEEWTINLDENLFSGAMFELSDMRHRHPYWGDIPVYSGSVITRSTWTGGVEQWRSLVASYFPADLVNRAMCVLNVETGGTGDPGSYNSYSGAAGLFQFLRSTWDGMVPSSVTGGSYSSGQVFLPVPNVRAAAWLWVHVGATQWSPIKRGQC